METTPHLRRLFVITLLGFMLLSTSSAQFPVEVGPECSPSITVDNHPLDPTVDDPLTVQACTPRVLVDDGNTPTDTQCDDVTCAFVRIDDGSDASNILDTVPSAASPDVLTWGGSEVWTAGSDGAGSGLDADTVDGYDVASLLVPPGAVMAFNLAACPSGWSTFSPAAGRTIVGVGFGSGLTARTLQETGGSEEHALTVAQMPTHSHAIQFNKHFAADGGNGDFGPGTGNTYSTDSTGGGQAFPIMQPFIALLYCEKD